MTTLKTRADFDAAPDRTIAVLRVGPATWVAQKQDECWFEAGCSDPFDEGSYRDWVGAITIDLDIDPTELGDHLRLVASRTASDDPTTSCPKCGGTGWEEYAGAGDYLRVRDCDHGDRR